MSSAADPPLSTLPGGDPETRAGRARWEPMAVVPVGAGRYDVVTAESRVYTVDLPDGSCTCPDHQHRDARCKHVRRVAMEVTAGRVPAPGERAVDCAVCGRQTFVDEDAGAPQFCDSHALEPGTVASDVETGTRVLVVAVSDRPADAVAVPGRDHSVAAHPTNRAYPDDDPVVAAVYPPLEVTDSGPVPGSLRVYSFPASRLRPV